MNRNDALEAGRTRNLESEAKILNANDPEVLRLQLNLLSRVSETENCWIWEGARAIKFCGIILFDKMPLKAHRVLWILKNKKLLKKEECLFRQCPTHYCVNPDHYRHVVSGINYKLSKEKVLSMRALKGKGLSIRKVGKMFGVSGCTVRKIQLRETWKHI